MHGCVGHMEVHLWGGCVLVPIALRNKQQKCLFLVVKEITTSVSIFSGLLWSKVIFIYTSVLIIDNMQIENVHKHTQAHTYTYACTRACTHTH